MVKTRIDNVYEYVKENILNGFFQPHQRLTEIELAEKTGASRNTVKKALIQLQKENLVDIQKNRGAFIRSFSLQEILNYLEIREYLEGLVARAAAVNITEEQISKLEEIIHQMEENILANQFDEYSKLNVVFHHLIYEASQKEQAVDIIMMIRNQIARYHFRSILIPGRKQISFNEHQQIFLAIKNRDPDSAEKAVRHHISQVSDLVKTHSSFM